MEIGPATSAVVTGGASGLGAATAQRLVARGVRVMIVDRNERLAKERANQLGCAYAALDVLDETRMQESIDEAATLGELRVLVCCAGMAGGQGRTVARNGSIHGLDAWRHVVEVNLVGTYNACRVFASTAATVEPDADGGRGAIVLTASCAAHDGQAGQTAYAAAKAGVAGLTLPLARDLEPLGIRVNTISPGTFDTPLFNPDLSDAPAAIVTRVQRSRDAILGEVLFPKRAGAPSEYAALAEQLLCNSYINGEVVRLDAGLRMRAK